MTLWYFLGCILLPLLLSAALIILFLTGAFFLFLFVKECCEDFIRYEKRNR